MKQRIDRRLLSSLLVRLCNKNKMEWVAMQCGVSTSCISYHCSLARNPKPRIIEAYARMIGVPIETFIIGTAENEAACAIENERGYITSFNRRKRKDAITTNKTTNENHHLPHFHQP